MPTFKVPAENPVPFEVANRKVTELTKADCPIFRKDWPMVFEYVPAPVAAPESVLKIAADPLELPDTALVTEYTKSALVRLGARVRAKVIHNARMGCFRLVRGRFLQSILM